MLHGSIGMTYEQASARALSFARTDGTVMTYRDGVLHHFNAAITTAITAARNRERLVRDFLDYRRSAVAEGREGRRCASTCWCPATIRRRADALARNLATQGIEVRRAEEAAHASAAARSPPARIWCRTPSRPAGWCATCST